MGRTTRRHWVLGATATLAAPALINPARGAEFNWRVGHTNPAAFPIHRRLVEAATEIKDKSAGRMTLTVTGDSQLGSPMGLLNQVRSGSLEISALLGQVLASIQAIIALPMAGFAWTGYDPLWKALDGELGQTVRDLARDRAGMLLMDTVWDFGFRNITTTEKEVLAAKDLTGLRLRTPVEPEFVALFQTLKASPVAMPLSETLRALRHGELDGQEGLLALVVAVGFQTAQRHCALTRHIWDGNWICVNQNHWRRLPDDLKTVVATALNNAGQRQRGDHAENETKAAATMTAAGVKMRTIDPSSFRAALREANYYRDLRRKFGSNNWDVLEKYAGRLA